MLVEKKNDRHRRKILGREDIGSAEKTKKKKKQRCRTAMYIYHRSIVLVGHRSYSETFVKELVVNGKGSGEDGL